MDKEIIYLRKNDNIEELLEYAMKEKQFIYTNESTRGIGKTTALVKFAKKHNFIILEPTYSRVNNIKKEFNYDKILCSNSICILRGMTENFVFDDGVYNFKELKNVGVDILTGFFTDKNNFDNEMYSDDEVIKQLNTNKFKLLQKINKSQDNNNQSDYKMLINNLLKTIEVRDVLKNPNKDATINNQYHFDTVSFPNAVNTDDIIKDLKNFGKKQFSMNYKYGL